MKETTIFHDLFVYDNDLNPLHVEYLVVSDGKVAYIGDELPCHGVVNECGGCFLAKSFCDYHYHLPGSQLYDSFGVNLSLCSTIDEYAAALTSSPHTSELVRAYGWEVEPLRQYFATTGRTPLGYIDNLFPDRPAILFSLDFHSCWCNSAALALLREEGIECDFKDKEIPRGGECILHEQIAEKIFKSERFRFGDREIRKAVLLQQSKLLSMGITEIYTLMFIGASYDAMLAVLKELDEEGLLKIKINFAYTATPTLSAARLGVDLQKSIGYNSAHLSLGATKIYMDGVVDNHSAFLLAPYADSGDRGAGIWKEENLTEFVRLSSRFGLPVHVHAIGDAAVGLAAKCLATVPPPAKGRNIIAHIQLCDTATMALMAANDIVACMQPFWFARGKHACAVDIMRLGTRANAEYPVKSLLRHGVKVTFSSDCPATVNCDPLLGMRTAAHDDGSEEVIDMRAAYRAYYAGSYQDQPVEIAIGDPATFVLFGDDIFSSQTAKVTATYIDGEKA